MKSLLTTTLAVALLAGSSFAFAADNNGGKNGGKNDTTMGQDQTGSIKSGTDSPDMMEKERCKTAPADDAKCAGLPKN